MSNPLVCQSSKKVKNAPALEKITLLDTKTGYTPLHLVMQSGCKEGSILEAAQSLIGNGASIESKTALGITPLHLACGAGLTTVVDFLLSKRADTTIPDCNGLIASDYADNSNHQSIVKLLSAYIK